MKYCENCSVVTGGVRCPQCGGKKLREVKDDDYCFLIELPALNGDMLADILRGNGIECVTMPSGSGLNTAMALPLENRKLFVCWKDWNAAAGLLREEVAEVTEQWRQFFEENIGRLYVSPKLAKKIVRKAKLGRGGDALEFCRKIIAEAERMEGAEVIRFSREQCVFCYGKGVVVTVNADTCEIVSVLFTRR